MPPRPVVAFAAAFVLGGVRVDSDLNWSMLALWVAVGMALGYRLPSQRAVSTGIVYGTCLGFASTFYGYRGHLLFVERLVEIAIGMAIGALCGAAVVAIGAAASHAIVGPASNR